MKKDILRYKTTDLIARLSSLNLVFENQNKNAAISDAILYCLHNIDENKPIITADEFSKIVCNLNDGGLLDSARSSFYEILHWTTDVHLFNGINSYSVATLNNNADLLLRSNSILPREFKEKASRFISCLVEISENMWKSLNLSWDDISKHEYIQDILVPDNIEEIANLMVVPREALLKHLSESELEQYLFCNDKINGLKKDYSDNLEPFYYYCPFYNLGSNVLILDPTCFATFLNNIILRFAHEFNCFDQYINEYHTSCFEKAILKCKVLSAINPMEESYYSLKTKALFKQEAYLISPSKILFICCIKQDSFSPRLDIDSVSNEIKSGYSKIIQSGFDEKSIYVLYLVNSYGGLYSFGVGFEPKNKPIILSCDELDILYENENRIVSLFEGYSSIKNYYYSLGQPIPSSDIDTFAFLNLNHYDFYLSDDMRIKDVLLYLGDDLLYPYTLKAISQENLKSTYFPYLQKYIKLRKCEDGLYAPDPLFYNSSDPIMIAIGLNYGQIIILTHENNNASFLMCRVIGYWIHQVETLLKKRVFETLYVEVREKNEVNFQCEAINSNYCILTFSKKYLERYSNDDNENEIKIVESVLHCLGLLTIDVVCALNKASSSKDKKIIYTIDTNKTPFMDPLADDVVPISRNFMLETLFDDLIGDYLIDHKIPFGACTNPNEILKGIVSGFFNKLEKFLKEFDWIESIKVTYLFAEGELYKLLLFQDNMKHQIALYPKDKDKIYQNYNDINLLSIGCRFITEYLVSTQPLGKKIIDHVDIEYAISIIQAIIKIAKVSDAVYFGLIPNQIEFLKSGRIAYDHEKLDKFYNIVGNTVADDVLKQIDFDGNLEQGEIPQEIVDKAYLEEFGFTIQDLRNTVLAFCLVGSKQKSDIKTANKTTLVSAIKAYKEIEIVEEKFWKVVEHLSISKRDNYFDNSIEKRELYPWKYNRRYSLIRKPIIKNNEIYVWGNRTLFNSFNFILNSIYGGYEKPLKKGRGPINELNGMMLKKKGEMFNDYCFLYLQHIMPNLRFYKNVTVINNKKLKDANGNILGDIDILGIDADKQSIYLIEVKDFFYSRDPHELADEIKDFFVGTKHKKSLLSLELKRVAWLKDHIYDCKTYYGLDWNEIKIKYCFLSKKPILCKEFTDKDFNCTHLKDISLEYLRNLK